jgi:hypothetical protein
MGIWKLLPLVAAAALVVSVTATTAFAGSPHFISANASRSGNTLTVDFKEAGLGNEPTVNIQVTATAQCINGGSNHPKAANKEQVSASGTFNVNNGQATGTLTVTTNLSCSPPMTITFTNVVVTDTSNGTSKSIPGTF